VPALGSERARQQGRATCGGCFEALHFLSPSALIQSALKASNATQFEHALTFNFVGFAMRGLTG
jgi:hypothetical protein